MQRLVSAGAAMRRRNVTSNGMQRLCTTTELKLCKDVTLPLFWKE
jgi:hypothetical protein